MKTSIHKRLQIACGQTFSRLNMNLTSDWMVEPKLSMGRTTSIIQDANVEEMSALVGRWIQNC
jgi:hypothetical protein